ncbi:glutaredoxin 3 [Pseudomonas sp. JS3066]|jgi:glutaredoxin 3|uniref:glutaredoxin 3 n=1 Tax=unclassified Pseudomonas TaxID=196821 RepID=UPI000EA91D43|nr:MULTISPECIES: glutaredoxin 3 [unclassified Pseudomonas]AYF86838.1 glutaredoxin 3 [Pseudomonas sp. DY-1]MDH4652248.1 glutaredoxin 3 [Pseudomonas sp. BN606]MRK21845.1 glutaredoxin 3 [Pseudomonas sp. JG-B]WVK95674.1 glutaredoxin 3 [Pseudomonas sp. JS3066]
MSQVTMYTTGYCPYCRNAKALLARRGVTATEIDVESDPRLRAEMLERTGRRTVPQIFIGERHVGGFDDLAALERQGELAALLA